MLRKPLGLDAANPLGLASGFVGSWKAAGTAAAGEAGPNWLSECALGFANWISDKLTAGVDPFKLDFIGLSPPGDLGVCIEFMCQVLNNMHPRLKL